MLRKRQQARAQALRHQKQKSTASESLANFRLTDSAGEGVNRPATPASIEEDSSKKSWQDYLLPTTSTGTRRPRELLSHTPSAGAVVTVSTADAEGTITPPRLRDTSISISASTQKALPTASHMSEARSSTVNAVSGEFSHDADDDSRVSTSCPDDSF